MCKCVVSASCVARSWWTLDAQLAQSAISVRRCSSIHVCTISSIVAGEYTETVDAFWDIRTDPTPLFPPQALILHASFLPLHSRCSYRVGEQQSAMVSCSCGNCRRSLVVSKLDGSELLLKVSCATRVLGLKMLVAAKCQLNYSYVALCSGIVQLQDQDFVPTDLSTITVVMLSGEMQTTA